MSNTILLVNKECGPYTPRILSEVYELYVKDGGQFRLVSSEDIVKHTDATRLDDAFYPGRKKWAENVNGILNSMGVYVKTKQGFLKVTMLDDCSIIATNESPTLQIVN